MKSPLRRIRKISWNTRDVILEYSTLQPLREYRPLILIRIFKPSVRKRKRFKAGIERSVWSDH